MVTLEAYKEEGNETAWSSDMLLAEQMGLVMRIDDSIYLLCRDAVPRFDMLKIGQKKRAMRLYESFGEKNFSCDMVIATLEYSHATASAYLHQLKLVKILDVQKGATYTYKFRVNPQENPECFTDVA